MSKEINLILYEELIGEDYQEILNINNSMIDFIEESETGIFINNDIEQIEDEELDNILSENFGLEEEASEEMDEYELCDLNDSGEQYVDCAAEEFEDAEVDLTPDEDGELIDLVDNESDSEDSNPYYTSDSSNESEDEYYEEGY